MDATVDANLGTILREHLDDDAYNIVTRGEIIPGKYDKITIHKHHAPTSCLMNLVLVNISTDTIRIVDEYLDELEELTRTNYINHMDDYGSILHYVSTFSMHNNNKALLKVILKYVCDINLCENISRNTALMAACSHFCNASDQETIQLLLNANGDPNLLNADGANVLHMICELPSSNAKGVEILLNAGVDPNLKTNTGVTALHKSCYASNIKTTKLLLDAGANPNAQTNSGSSPLIYMKNTAFDFTLIQLLLGAGANPNLKTNLGVTALHRSCYASNIKGTQLLLNANANPNAQTDIGSTPLIFMMSPILDITMIQLLLDAGANINMPNYQNQSALMIYCKTNKPDPNIIEYLICKAKADCTLRCKLNKDAYDYLLDQNISPRLHDLLKGYSFVNMTKRAQALSES